MGTLFPEAAPEGTRTLTWLIPRGHPGVWRRGCAPWDTFVRPRIFADHSDGGGKTPVEMQAKANTVHLRVASRRFPDGRLGALTCQKSGMANQPGAFRERRFTEGIRPGRPRTGRLSALSEWRLIRPGVSFVVNFPEFRDTPGLSGKCGPGGPRYSHLSASRGSLCEPRRAGPSMANNAATARRAIAEP